MFLSLRGNKIVQDSSSLQRRVRHPRVYSGTQTGNGVSSNLRQRRQIIFQATFSLVNKAGAPPSPWWEAAGNAEAPPPRPRFHWCTCIFTRYGGFVTHFLPEKLKCNLSTAACDWSGDVINQEVYNGSNQEVSANGQLEAKNG